MRLRHALLAACTVALSACGGGGGQDAAAAKLLAELPAPYNAGDPVRGKNLFALCSACHTTAEGAANMTGPNLHGVFGAKAGSKPSFAYSEALKATGWTWDAALIDQWITNPAAHVPGSKMVFVGVKDEAQRRDIIAYLKVATGA